MKLKLLFFLLLCSSVNSFSQAWNNKRCAVVLTYDDALNVHLDNAIPLLDSLNLKATFYLSAFFPGCRDRLNDWKSAAANGHELGNHTLFHPCIGNASGREWVSKERNLGSYTMSRFLDEIRMTNVFLQALDGKTRRTFAYPCGDTLVENQSVLNEIEADFVAARGVKGELVLPDYKKIFLVGAYGINGQTGEQMIKLVKGAIAQNALIVFLFHGVGGEHSLDVGLRDHRQLLQFLKDNEKDLWVAPLIDVADYMIKKNPNLRVNKG